MDREEIIKNHYSNTYDEDICPHCGAIMDLKYKEGEE